MKEDNNLRFLHGLDNDGHRRKYIKSMDNEKGTIINLEKRNLC